MITSSLTRFVKIIYGFVKQRSRDSDPFQPFFRRHDISELHRLCCDDFVIPLIMTCALQNMQFSQYFTTKFDIFSLHLTGESEFLFYLLVRIPIFLWVVFDKIWIIRFFAVVNYMVRKFSFCSNIYADVIANIIFLHIFINLKIAFNSWNMILMLKSVILIGTFIIHKKRVGVLYNLKQFCSKGWLCVLINTHALVQPPFSHLTEYKKNHWNSSSI